LKVATTATLVVRFSIVQVSPDTEPQPDHPPNVPKGVAVRVTSVPVGKLALHKVAVLAQLSPRGELLTVPNPVPRKVTEIVGPEPPPLPVVDEKQMTFAVM
jgi:hypothetical protein